MRKFKDITNEELEAKVSETVYYYLLSDLVESHNANDKEAFDNALKLAKESWDKRDQIIESIKQYMINSCEPDDTYEDFEDSLFDTTEHEIY